MPAGTSGHAVMRLRPARRTGCSASPSTISPARSLGAPQSAFWRLPGSLAPPSGLFTAGECYPFVIHGRRPLALAVLLCPGQHLRSHVHEGLSAAVHHRPRRAVPLWSDRWRSVVDGHSQYSKACDGATHPWVQIPPPPLLTWDDAEPVFGAHRCDDFRVSVSGSSS